MNVCIYVGMYFNNTRCSDLVIVNKKKTPENLLNSGFCHIGRRQSKNKSKRKERYVFRPFHRIKKKTMEHELDSDTNCNWYAWNNPQRLGKGTGRLRNQRTSGDHSDYITKLYYNWPEYWEESWRHEEIWCSLNSIERPSANTDVKIPQGVIIIMIIISS